MSPHFLPLQLYAAHRFSSKLEWNAWTQTHSSLPLSFKRVHLQHVILSKFPQSVTRTEKQNKAQGNDMVMGDEACLVPVRVFLRDSESRGHPTQDLN